MTPDSLGTILAATSYWDYVKIFEGTRAVIDISRFNFGQRMINELADFLVSKGHKLVALSNIRVVIDHSQINRNEQNQHTVDIGREVLRLIRCHTKLALQSS